MSLHWGGRGAGHISRWSAATTGVPALVLDFLTTTSLDSRITFTRASTATFVGSNGLIQSAAIDAPRFDYDPVTRVPNGLLIEEQRTNLLTYSEQFNNASWTKATGTVTADSLVSPDGATNADTYTQNTGTTGELIRASNYTVVANTDFSLSGFFKSVNATPAVALYATAGGNGFRVIVNLSTGATISSGAIGTGTFVSSSVTAFGNGWYRISVTGRLATGVTTGQWRMNMADLAGNNLVGDGSKGIGLYGAQSEQASFATSYIPTVASQVTRNADVAAMTSTNFSSWYNQSAGTMVCEFAPEGLTTGGAVSNVWAVNASATPSTNFTRLREGKIISGADAEMFAGGALQVDSSSFTLTANVAAKSAFAWATNSGMLAANGALIGAEDTSVTPPTVNQLVLTGGNKWLRRLAFYGSRLNNSQIQTLTQ